MEPRKNSESPSGMPEDSFFAKDTARYRVSPDYVLREVAGECVMIPVGEGCKIRNGRLSLQGLCAARPQGGGSAKGPERIRRPGRRALPLHRSFYCRNRSIRHSGGG